MWFITVFEKIEKKGKCIFPSTGEERTWGYFRSRDTATTALHNNWTDMNETIYNYAVLEKIEEGICCLATERQFFKWDEERKGFFEIDEPDCVKNIINFALG